LLQSFYCRFHIFQSKGNNPVIEKLTCAVSNRFSPRLVLQLIEHGVEMDERKMSSPIPIYPKRNKYSPDISKHHFIQRLKSGICQKEKPNTSRCFSVLWRQN
jgi:hypothetical protein